MRFYTQQHPFYCGIDLHARTMYLCILDQAGETLLHRNMPATPEALLKAIAPYREQIVLAAECMFTWYWLADLCAEHGIPFVLGHALYMKAIHGAKPKTIRLTPIKLPCCCAAACSHRPMSTPPKCVPPVTCSADACTSHANVVNSWHTCKIRTVSTIYRPSAKKSPIKPTATGSPSVLPIRRCKK